MSLTPTGVPHDDPFVADRLETVAKRLALLDVSESEGIAAVIAESEDEWRSPPHPPEPDPELDGYGENRSRHLDRLGNIELARLARGALLNMQAQRGIDLGDDVSRISCPVLIVHGDADTTVPVAFGEALASSIPDAEFVRFYDIGHGLIVDPIAQSKVAWWLAQSTISTSDQSKS